MLILPYVNDYQNSFLTVSSAVVISGCSSCLFIYDILLSYFYQLIILPSYSHPSMLLPSYSHHVTIIFSFTVCRFDVNFVPLATLTNRSADVRTASPCHCSAVVCPALSATFRTTTHAFNSLQNVCSFNSLMESFCTMSAPVNKFYHPGACHLIDAYFRLNMSW